MALNINGNEFRVAVAVDGGLESTSGQTKLLGRIDDAQNLVILDGGAPKDRQAEVLLHELLHASDNQMPESIIRSLSQSLYGILSDNNLIPKNFLDRAIDGTATKAEIQGVIDDLDAREEAEREAGFPTGSFREPVIHTYPEGDDGEKPSKPDDEPETGDDAAGRASGGAAGSGEPQNVDGLKSALQRERTARRLLDKEVSGLRKFKDEADTANQTETERLTAENAALREDKAALEISKADALKQAAFTTAAVAAEVKNPATAFRVIDGETLTVEPDGSVSGIDEVIAGLKTSDPYMFGTPTGPQQVDSAAGGAEGPKKAPVTAEQRAVGEKLGVNL